MKWLPAWNRLYFTHKYLIEIGGLRVVLVRRLFTPTDLEDSGGSGKKKKKKLLKVISFF